MIEISVTPDPPRHFNARLLRQELRAAFPVKFLELQVGGFHREADIFDPASVAYQRVFVPRTEDHIQTQVNDQKDIYTPGELRIQVKSALTTNQLATFQALLLNHDENGVTSIQADQDSDQSELDVIEAFFAQGGGDFMGITNNQRNKVINAVCRLVLRRNKRLKG